MPTTSFWEATKAIPARPALQQNLQADVVVVGGGNTGITAAYLMKRAGLKVVLLERDQCGHEEPHPPAAGSIGHGQTFSIRHASFLKST